MDHQAPAPAQPLRVEVEGRVLDLPAGADRLVGRAREADVRLEDDRIGRRHAFLRHSSAGWTLVDNQSLNGIWRDGSRVAEVPVPPSGVTVMLGGRQGVELRLVPVRPEAEAAWPGADTGPALSAVHRVPRGATIGRAPGNDVVLTDLLVSRRHAELTVSPDGAEIRDLGSGNGTYVNGERVQRRRLAVGDTVTIGPHVLRFDGTQLLEYVDTGDVGFGARELTVTVAGGKRLLDGVSFALGARSLMAIIGPSGAGKSTLLGALTGVRPATTGRVLYAGRDLYAEYDELRQRIGFVPQQDILHQPLTLQQALGYGAELRFPADTTAAERKARISEVTGELGLTQQLDTRISQLSGGERKRASTAMELLTKPSLLFLDEPTSGLDINRDLEVMTTLRGLADDGRTVIVVTHSVAHLDVCDVVMVLAPGGHVAYLGPPDQALGFFGARTWAEVFAGLVSRPGKELAERFAASKGRDPRADAPSANPDTSRPTADLTPIKRQPVAAQLATLARRYVAVTVADRALLSILVLLPVVLALIARVVPAPNGLQRVPGNIDARQLLLVLVVGGSLMGAASAVRELVKERAIYQRERAVGLSAAAYLASKVAVLTGIALVQGAVLTVLALVGRAGAQDAALLGSPFLEIVLAVALLTAVSAAVGLVISAIVRDENQAMPLLVLVTMAQLVLCGGLVPVVGRAVLEQLSWLLPARWGFAASASTVDLLALEPRRREDGLWDHSAATWLADMTVLAGLGAVAVAVVAVLLRRLEPQSGRRG